MFNFWTVMYLLVVGIIAGFVAALLVTGRDRDRVLVDRPARNRRFVRRWLPRLGAVRWDEDEGALQPGGVIFSIIGAVLVLLIWRAIDRRRTPAA